MNRIELKGCIPDVFYLAALDGSVAKYISEVWNSECSFTKGESYLVKADSGRGKTSLCSFLMGSRTDYQGEVLFDGESIKELGLSDWEVLRKENIAYLPQGLMLFDELSALDNILLKNQLSGGYRTREWILEALECLEIGDRTNYQSSKLSYGQRQRVALIRSLCQPFDFLILDEPVSHLDSTTSQLMASLVSRELQSSGAGLLVTSIGKELPVDYSKVLVL